MKTKIAALVLAMLLPAIASAGVAFFKREYTSGMNKICIYDHLGSEVAITLKATQICPVSIRV